MIWRGKWRKEVCSFLHSVLIVHPYALEVLCLKVRTSLQVLGFTCTIYYPSFKSKIQSLDPLGSKSRKTGWVVVSLQRFEHFDLIFVKARKIVAYLFLKITLNVLHNLFQPSFLKLMVTNKRLQHIYYQYSHRPSWPMSASEIAKLW